MGHMIAFGLLTIICGFTQTVGSLPRGPSADYGNGMILAGVGAVVWAGVVLLARLIP